MESASPGLAEANLFDLFRAMASTLPGGELHVRPWATYHHASPLNPMFKGVWGPRIQGDVAGAIDDALAWFAERDAAVVFWWCDQGTTPQTLGDNLLSRGFQPFEVRAPVMEAAIEALEAPHRAPPELSIVLVDSEPALGQWKAAFLESFGVPEFAVQAWVEATVELGFARAPWRMMNAHLGREVVGSAMLFVSGPTAGLIQMGVVPAARRRGIGAALQLARVDLARQLGCTHAALFASKDGFSSYERLGFHDTGRRLSRYLLLRDDLGQVANRERLEG